MQRATAATMLAIVVLGSARAQGSADQVRTQDEQSFRAATEARLRAIEARFQKGGEGDQAKAEADKDKPKDKSWFELFKLSGDLRLRHEMIDTETTPLRQRERIRARLNVDAAVNEDIKVGARLATGESADPVSTNQTLTGGFGHKNVFFDAAFVDWTATKGVDLIGGKMNLPFFKAGGRENELIWDNDLTPEGAALRLATKSDGTELFANGGVFVVNERATTSDAMLYAAQGGVRIELAKDTALTVGASFFAYGHAKGLPTFFSTATGFGNSTVGPAGSLVYATGFQEAEAFAQLDLNLFELPLALYGDLVENTATGMLGQGYLFGASLGRVKDPGSWVAAYTYRKVDKDAVIGAFNASDDGGGGTNNRGHKLSLEVAVAKRVSVMATYMHDDTGIATKADLDYERTQLDILFRF